MIDPTLAFNHGVAHRLSLALATLVVGQTLTSESDVPFFLFGRLAGGPLVGLSSIAIET